MAFLRSSRTLIALAVTAVTSIAAYPIIAQEATPDVSGEPSRAVIARGLTSPREMVWGTNDTIIVALAGSGGIQRGQEIAPATDVIGPWHGGPTSAIATIDVLGCPVLLAGGLPSSMDRTGGVLGAEDLAVLNGQLYVSVDGGGGVHGNPNQPSGIYLVYGGGGTELIADLSAWVRENPVDVLPGDHDPDAAGYSIVADQEAGVFWVSDPNSGQILTVTPDGEITRLVDLSDEHLVPTRMAPNPDGGVYVGTLTGEPYTDGEAKVMSIDPDGTVTDVWTGLTAVADVVVGPDGDLYALEMSTDNTEEPPFLNPDTGRLVRQTGEDELEVVVEGLTSPVAMEVGPDGAFYVSSPAIGATEGEGIIERIALDGSMPQSEASEECEQLPETVSFASILAPAQPTPTPEPTATPSPTSEPTATPSPEPTSTPSPTPEPTATPTPEPTATPTPEPTATPTPQPTATPTPEPTATPTPEPTATPTPEPTATPTPEPTATPTPEPTATPTPEPTATPTPEPTATPTPEPTATPTPEPTATPTPEPTATATPEPTPTLEPTPTPSPTAEPTATPTEVPVQRTIPVVFVTPEPEETPSPTAEPTIVPVATPAATSDPTTEERMIPVVIWTPEASSATPAATGTPNAGSRTIPVVFLTPEAGSQEGEEVEILIEGFEYGPAEIEITAGTTVTWANEDGMPHTATATDGIFDTGMIDAGALASVTFDDAGTFAYVCDLHPDMEGVVVVVEAD